MIFQTGSDGDSALSVGVIAISDYDCPIAGYRIYISDHIGIYGGDRIRGTENTFLLIAGRVSCSDDDG